MFLGITATVNKLDMKKQSFRLTFEENPLIEFVELPDHLKDKLQVLSFAFVSFVLYLVIFRSISSSSPSYCAASSAVPWRWFK